MAYCVSCGAYIPDGQSECLACGYDESVKARESKKTGAASGSYAAGAQEKNEDLREVMERHRRLQQEKSRQWAEQEKARRQQQESSRQWAEQEYARRQAAKEVEEESQRRQRETRTYAYRSTSASGTGNKALATLSYLSVLFALPYLFAPEDCFAKYHAKQGLKLFIFGILADILGGLTGLGWIVSLLRFYLMFKGMSNAANGRMEPLPWIGTLGEQN